MPEPQDLIATAELEAALGDPALRIYAVSYTHLTLPTTERV